jgi:signal transduction histidine kinase
MNSRECLTHVLSRSGPRRQVSTFLQWTGLCVITGILVVVGAPAMAGEQTANVLVIYANSRLLPANVKYDQGLRTAIAKSKKQPVSIFDEFLDVPRLNASTSTQTMVSYLHDRYLLYPPDVVIAANDAALQFMLDNRAELFPRSPVVFMSTTRTFLQSIPRLPADVIGVPIEYDFSDTVEQALRWHPKARRLVIVTGTTEWDRGWEARLRREAPLFKDRAPAEFLAGLPTAVVLERLGNLGSDALVYTPGYFKDGAGRNFVPREAVEAMVKVATAPIYAPFDTFMGSGVVGGRMPSYEAMGRQAGLIANALLDGAAPASLSLPEVMPTALNVDWRQVRRWGIDESLIPSDAVVQFRESSLLREHRNEVIIAAAVLLFQAALIIVLMVERRRRRIAEGQSRARLSEMAHMNRREAMGGLAASIAHELNQPLGAIHNNAGAAKILIKANPPRLGEITEILDDIQKDDRRASDVVGRVRKMLRNVEADVGDLDLNEAIIETMGMLTHDAEAKGVSLKAELATGLPKVRADRVQMQQVILNLTLNAMEALQDTPEAKRQVVVRSARANDKEAEISVVDSGAGILEEVMSRVFKPFVTSKSNGMGLGLSISRAIVEAHGGKIRAENLSGGGAAFHFTLPFASAHRA